MNRHPGAPRERKAKYTNHKENADLIHKELMTISHSVEAFRSNINLFQYTVDPSREPGTLAIIDLFKEFHIVLERNQLWKSITVYDVAFLLHKISSLKYDFIQQKLIPLQDALWQKTLVLSADVKMHPYFNEEQICQLLTAIPKLPLIPPFQKYRILTDFLLNALKDLRPNFHQIAAILGVLGKLNVDFAKHSQLITELLNRVTPEKLQSQNTSITMMSQLWTFCVYTKNTPAAQGTLALQKSAILFDYVEHMLKQGPSIEPSNSGESFIQKKFFDFIKALLQKKYKQEMISEYRIGAYTLDIAFPSLKINIEIDGALHYRGENLRLADKFRDFILKEYDNWRVIRFPWFETKNMMPFEENKRLLSEYIRKKLEGTELFEL